MSTTAEGSTDLSRSSLPPGEEARAPRLWVVIPVRDQCSELASTLDDHLLGLRDDDHVVVVVTGGSRAAEDLVRSAQALDRRIDVVVDRRPIERGTALALGLREVARRASPDDIASYADVEDALPADELLRLAATLEPGELVVGSRWSGPAPELIRQPRARRAAGMLFNRYVRHALDLDLDDTQCTGKMLFVGDLRRCVGRLSATSFAFDVDLILAAQEADISPRECEVAWEDRSGSRVHARNGVAMIGDVRRMRRKYQEAEPAPKANTKLTLYGTHPTPEGGPIPSASVLSRGQAVVLALALVGLVVALVIAPSTTLIAVNGAFVVFFFAANVMKLMLVRRAHRHPCAIEIDARGHDRIADHDLPIYTILLPVYREASVLPQLVTGVARLDYPSERLDVKLLLEEDDHETRAAAEAMILPSYFEVLVVPDDGMHGKPRACNYGLARARGAHLVIYDAEDQPEPDQLRKSVAAFRRAAPDLVCLQAKLNYFNRTHNALTRLFTAEYSMLFDQLLPGLQSLDVAIPLGGTSNHFVTERLLQLGGWNACNVTEDADLGIRIYLRGWKTAVLDSTTYEEANSRYGNWIRQRSRWVKGHMQTYLLHMRHPVALARGMGLRAFIVFQLLFGAGTICLLLAPLYWALAVLWYVVGIDAISAAFPLPLLYLGTLGLIVGTAGLTLCAISGCYERRHYDDVKWALLSPLYMLLMSVAAWKAFIQLIYKPLYWEKTVHGYCTLETEVAA